MGQTLIRNYIHIVFGTKGRKPWIDNDIKDELFSYLGGICQNHKCHPIIVGGYHDHIHILCILSPDITLSNLIWNIKKESSKWIKRKSRKYREAYWQEGFGSFSVNPRKINTVKNYILNQEHHHKKTDFREEYENQLNHFGIEFNPEYLWR